jgi:ribonuclease R
MHEDKVLVRLMKEGELGHRPEGKVIRILQRTHNQIVGTYRIVGKYAQVVPDDPRFFYPVTIRNTKGKKLKNGNRVLVEITVWPTQISDPEGRILEVFGKTGEPGVDRQIVIKKHMLREVFNLAAVEEAKTAAAEPVEAQLAERADLRHLPIVTIDGEDAKDLDDGVSLEIIPEGYRLGVHIADVSHYVREDSELDQEALARGTSVYLVDYVLPMLPPLLSNGICSLNAGEPRLAVSCIMDINHEGQVMRYELVRSVIQVRERMTYTAVNHILAENDPALAVRYAPYVESFKQMHVLAEIIRKERYGRGSLDFDFPEAKIITDAGGYPVDIKKIERGPGEMLIEDFMIKANETVAEHLYWQNMPILYRVHEKPSADVSDNLIVTLATFGHKVRWQKLGTRVWQRLLEEIKGTPHESTLSLMILRSLKQAVYMPEALGHFGLASAYYCHFTSPIRRYPDLLVHRVLTMILTGEMTERKRNQLTAKMPAWGEECSILERRAEEAERDLVNMKKAQYMKQFLGEIFTARIVSVQSFGMFVALDNTVEGLIHISTLYDDYYEYDQKTLSLHGRNSGKIFRIGDVLKVQLVRVDENEAKIDFELI